MRKPARACLPDTFAALPKVISDECPWQQLKQIHRSKGEGQEEEARAGSWYLVGT